MFDFEFDEAMSRLANLEARIKRDQDVWLGEIRAIKAGLTRIRELTLQQDQRTPEYLPALPADDDQ